jgi:site-specific DNA recombinase
MIAAGYFRKSNDEKDKTAELKSVAVQRGLAETFAASKGWSLEFTFDDDGISGAEFLGRPGLQKLLAALKAKPVPFKVLIVSEQSRLGRETLDTLLVIRALEQAGVAVWSAISGRQITMADDNGEIMAFLDSWRDTGERKKTIVRVRNAAFTRFAEGYVTGGRVYGYTNVRLPGVKAPAKLVIDDEQSTVVRRIFSMTAEGYGLTKIAKQLNAEGIAGPQRLSAAKIEEIEKAGRVVPVNRWSSTGVREVLHRELYKGDVVLGKVKRTGPRTRERVPASEWKHRQDESLRIVDDATWDAAHARTKATSTNFLRAAGGKLIGSPERTRGMHMLSGFLVCGAPARSPRLHGQDVCGEPLIVTTRGRNHVQSYVCRAVRAGKGPGYCDNTSAVPMDAMHHAVVASLRETFSAETFEKHLQQVAADTGARESRQAERATLIARIPVLSTEAERLADAVAAGHGSLDVLLGAIKQRQQEREQAEARLAELEGEERDLRADTDAVARLRDTWATWSARLDDDPVLGRQILRKTLAGPIVVKPFREGRGYSWMFSGTSRFDLALKGGLADGHVGVVFDSEARSAALMAAAVEMIEGLGAARQPIAGGSDAPQGGGYDPSVRSGPPCRSIERHGYAGVLRASGGLGAMSGPPMSINRAPRLRRGAPSVGGFGGHVGAPT